MTRRCRWPRNPLAIAYHDKEWGVPVRNDRRLFEFLILEGAQAGLSWDTILAKRENYRKAFDGFDPKKISKYTAKKKKALMKDAGIVRNRLKIESAQARGGGAGANRSLGRAVEGPQAPRLQVRRLDHHVRVHAGHRPRERPHGAMFPVQNAAQMKKL